MIPATEAVSAVSTSDDREPANNSIAPELNPVALSAISHPCGSAVFARKPGLAQLPCDMP
jgi:hypothetical protein